MKLTLAMIVRDEQLNLDACLSSVERHVDEIVVVDTGSADDTREIARRHGARVSDFVAADHPAAFFRDDDQCGGPPPYSGEVVLGDFAAARNASLDLARGDFVLWLDADDVLEGAGHLRRAVDEMQARRLDYGFLPYIYASDDRGRPTYRQWRERIIRAGCARWANPVHEVLLPSRSIQSARLEGITVQHRRRADRKCTPHRNYKILLRQLAGDLREGREPDPRTLFYLGQESRFVQPDAALRYYAQYLRVSGWNEERAAAHVAVGQVMEARADYQGALREYATAAVEDPASPDGVLGCARTAYHQRRWSDCVEMTRRGLAMGCPDSLLGMNPLERLYAPHIYLNFSLNQLGRVEEALASCAAGLLACPDDPGVPGGSRGQLLLNKAAYEAHLDARRAPPPDATYDLSKSQDLEAPAGPMLLDARVILAIQLWKETRDSHGPQRALALLDAVPDALHADPVMLRARELTAAAISSDRSPQFNGALEADRPRLTGGSRPLDVVVWTGPAIEWWSPRTPSERGIGGSETACVEVCRNLAARGHRVTAYTDCPHMDGEYDGVTYRHFGAMLADKGASCDVFVSSRDPGVIGLDVRARASFLWVHDVGVGAPGPQMSRWLLRFDRVLALSHWHREGLLAAYDVLHPEAVLVTRNGIDPARFSDAGAPRLDRLVYSSSPNRGLANLLDMWPDIRARAPRAELHAFYGFDCWEAFARRAGNQGELREIAALRDRLASTPGVVARGRVNQVELAREFMAAKVWAYPTAFGETYCVTAAEAQAAGLVPVTSRLGALAETVRHGVLLDGPNYGAEYRRRFVDECSRLLVDEEYRSRIGGAGRQHALRDLTWAGLAADWEGMFGRVIAEVAANPVPRWRAAA